VLRIAARVEGAQARGPAGRAWRLMAHDGLVGAKRRGRAWKTTIAPANVAEREVAAETLRRVDLHGYTVIADKGFAGADFEALMA
jgi:hypothetical protein